MKSGIIFLIHWAIVFVVLLIYGFLAKSTQIDAKFILGLLLTSGIIAGIILLFSTQLNVNENFLFQVSDAKQKCMDEQVRGGPNRSPGCCSKDLAGVGSLSPFPMTVGNFPYRADQVLPNQKASVPPIDSCACDTKAYESNIEQGKKAEVQYPSNYLKLQETGNVNIDPVVAQEAANSKEDYSGDNKRAAIQKANIEMYISDNCSHCTKTKEAFKEAGIDQYITYKDAHENIDFLKGEGIRHVPFIKCGSGSHEGYCKGADDLITKLNIQVDSVEKDDPVDSIDSVEKDKKDESGSDYIASSTYVGSKEGYVFTSRVVEGMNRIGYYRDAKYTGSLIQAEPLVKKEKYEPSQDSTPKQIMNANGKMNETAVEYFIENYAPNYKANNYLSKPSDYTGYYSYENYLPDSVKYGSMAGQLVPPGPCGRSQEGTR